MNLDHKVSISFAKFSNGQTNGASIKVVQVYYSKVGWGLTRCSLHLSITTFLEACVGVYQNESYPWCQVTHVHHDPRSMSMSTASLKWKMKLMSGKYFPFALHQKLMFVFSVLCIFSFSFQIAWFEGNVNSERQFAVHENNISVSTVLTGVILRVFSSIIPTFNSFIFSRINFVFQ